MDEFVMRWRAGVSPFESYTRVWSAAGGRSKGHRMHSQALVFSGFLFVGLALGWVLVTLPRLLAPRGVDRRTGTAYECGELPVGEPWVRFRVEYYIFALAFVVFDVEAVFLYPWAVVVGRLGVYGLVQMAVFIGILVLGLAYAWRKGVLEWR